MKFSEAVRAALQGHEPSREQRAVIAHDPVPLAVVAGAGSGKTAVMAARIVWMAENGIADPAGILGLSFTNKAAAELEGRVHEAFAFIEPQPPELPAVMTYNSFADRVVREHGVRVGIDPEVGLLSEGQSWQLMLKALEEAGPFDAIDSRSARSVCRDGLTLAEQCDNQLLAPEDVAAEDQRIIIDADYFGEEALLASRKRKELAGLVRAYIDIKRRYGRIDYGDQVAKAVEILHSFPEVADELRSRYPAVLLDEYQDTNVAQRRLLEAFALDPAQTGAGNITAVGDARQNIFQWRGSTLFNLIDFPKHFPRRGGERYRFISLSQNFRSGARILQVANEIIEPVPPDRRPGLPLAPFGPNGDGFVGVRLLSDQRKEAQFIAEEIFRLHEDGRDPGGPLDWSDCAVLVRRRKHIGPIYEAFREHDIPVEVLGLGGLLEVPEVVDLSAWLRVVADTGPAANRWLARVLFGPRFRIHYRDLALLARWAETRTKELAALKQKNTPTAGPSGSGVVVDSTKFEPDEVAFSLSEALDHLSEIPLLPSEAKDRLIEARRDIDLLRAHADAPLTDLVNKVIEVSGLGEALLAGSRTDSAAAAQNLKQFIGVVDSFSPVSGQVTLGEFLAFLDAAEEAEDSLDLQAGSGGDSVKLMTVHSAKGLEFGTVFVPGVAARENEKAEKVDSVFPDTRTTNPYTSASQLPFAARADSEHLPQPWETGGDGERVLKKPVRFREELKQRAIEDERRLFYVALTRAKIRLYVTAAWWYERNMDCRGPSIFFEEVRDSSGSQDLGQDLKPEVSPMIDELRTRAIWPPDPNRSANLFAGINFEYPKILLDLLSGAARPEDLLSRLGPGARKEAQILLERHRYSLSSLAENGEQTGGARNAAPGKSTSQSLSATRAVDLSSGEAAPGDLLWPLPQPPSPSRQIGMEIHSWIEEHAHGLTGLADEDALDETSRRVPASAVGKLRHNFFRMGYSKRVLARLDSGEPMAELPFVLKLGHRLLRGRIDAVYMAEDGRPGLEIVDFKTGTQITPPPIDQLMVYAGALVKLGRDPGGPLKLTYCYLASGETRSRTIERVEAMQALAILERHLDSLGV